MKINQLITFTAAIMMALFVANTTTAKNVDDEYEDLSRATNWYANHTEGIITRFEGLRHDSGELPQKYCVIPYADAGYPHYAFIVSTWDQRRMIMFTPEGKDVKGKIVGKDVLPEGIYWESMAHLLRYKTMALDVTLSQRPLPVRSNDQKHNIFRVVVDTSDKIKDIQRYNQMMFKPHKNPVRFVAQDHLVKKGEAGDTILDEMQYDFKLNTPSIVSKMFRGYGDEEMTPWIVKKEFFDTHTLLQFSRWKDGEPIRKADSDVRQAISTFYSGRRIKDTMWLATVESTGCSYYAVQFEIEGGDALAAMVAYDGEAVTSTWEFHGSMMPNTYKEGQSIWFVDDEGDFMSHAPELQCIVATDAGTEIYLRLFGGESVQYYILREVGCLMMDLQVDYWIYVW